MNPQPRAPERLLEFSYVEERLVEMLGLSPDDANIWIFSPNWLLDGDKPSERIHTGDYRSVLALIDTIADGMVA